MAEIEADRAGVTGVILADGERDRGGCRGLQCRPRRAGERAVRDTRAACRRGDETPPPFAVRLCLARPCRDPRFPALAPPTCSFHPIIQQSFVRLSTGETDCRSQRLHLRAGSRCGWRCRPERSRTPADHRQCRRHRRHHSPHPGGTRPMHARHDAQPQPLRAATGGADAALAGDPGGFRGSVPLDGWGPLWTGLARMGGILPAPGRADSDPWALLRRGEHPSGRGRADGRLVRADRGAHA